MLEIFKPTKPYGVNTSNPFGANPAYYKKFIDAAGKPELGHPGLDLIAPHGTPLYAPVAGEAQYLQDAHGGDGIHIETADERGQHYVIILWHLCGKDDPQFAPKIPTDGTKSAVKVGDLLGYTDNTGAPFESSGDHLHLGVMPVYFGGPALNPENGYGGCVDPAPFMSGLFAQDIPIIEETIGKIRELVTLLSQEIKNYVLTHI